MIQQIWWVPTSSRGQPTHGITHSASIVPNDTPVSQLLTQAQRGTMAPENDVKCKLVSTL